MNLEAVVRGAGRFDRAQSGKAADAVIDVDDEIAGGKPRHFGDEILGALGWPARANKPFAENVLFGNKRDIVGLEAGFQAEPGADDPPPPQARSPPPRVDP